MKGLNARQHSCPILLTLAAIWWLAATATCREAPQGSTTIEMAPDAIKSGEYITIVGESIPITPEDAATAVAMAAVTSSDASVSPQQSSLYKGIMDLHNSYRAKHGVGPLTWSNDLATSAAGWASKCIWRHSGLGPGENLYATSQRNAGATALADGVKAWYDEISLYDFNNPGFSAATGHFTQVIWRASTQLGCAVQDCANMEGFMAGTYVVCHYLPPGNVIGYFPQNVPPVGGGGTSPPPTSPNPGGVKYDPATAIPANKMLPAPNCITSTNKKHKLCVLRNGDVQIQTANSANRFRKTWSIGTRAPAGSTRPYALGLFPNGNLAAFDKNYKIYWQTGTSGVGTAPYVAVLRDTGNLILYDNTGKCLWSAKKPCAKRIASP